MPLRTTPEAATGKWVNRLSGATAEITAGVDRVQTSPGQLAAQKADKWLAEVQAAAAKWRRNTGAVSLEDWRKLMKDVGIPRIAQGAQAKQSKVLAFQRDFFPHLERGITRVEAMPDTTFEDRIQRAVAMMRHNREYKRGGGVTS